MPEFIRVSSLPQLRNTTLRRQDFLCFPGWLLKLWLAKASRKIVMVHSYTDHNSEDEEEILRSLKILEELSKYLPSGSLKISLDVYFGKNYLHTCQPVVMRLAAEFSDTQTEKRGTQGIGANPHSFLCSRASNLPPEPDS
jgi:hypothetical protein